MPDILAVRYQRARLALDGLSIGDAFGERFFVHPATAAMLIAERAIPHPPWPFTDDTLMALSILTTLRTYGAIEQNFLVDHFLQMFDPDRGYGPAMHRLFAAIREGDDWTIAAPALFNGQGSFGNGAAMRVAPLGAWFADDLAEVVRQAEASAVVTHSHPEAVAGAIAVAVATAIATTGSGMSHAAFLDTVIACVPPSQVRTGLMTAAGIEPATHAIDAARVLGNGSRVTAQDTVPFALWCAACHLDDYVEAIWTVLAGQGDCDTNAAIVGGIVASVVGPEGIPSEWRDLREPLPL